MAQHFLRSPRTRDLTITELCAMQERTAKKWFRQARWPEMNDEPYCRALGSLRCYAMSRERQSAPWHGSIASAVSPFAMSDASTSIRPSPHSDALSSPLTNASGFC